MSNIKKRIVISLEEAEQHLAKFALDALVGNYVELSRWAKSAPISIRGDTPIVKIETARTAALNFMSGKISAGKLGELLDLMPGEVADFKRAIMVYNEEKEHAPTIKLEKARIAAINFMYRRINVDEFAELLGLLPGEETMKFKRAVTVYRNANS